MNMYVSLANNCILKLNIIKTFIIQHLSYKSGANESFVGFQHQLLGGSSVWCSLQIDAYYSTPQLPKTYRIHIINVENNCKINDINMFQLSKII